MEHSQSPSTPSRHLRKSRLAHKANWDFDTVCTFLQLVIKELDSGFKGSFHTMTMHGYRAIAKAFEERTHKVHEVKQLQNKYASLKKDWQSWSCLMDSRHGPTGISYNEATGLIQASDDWWAHYEKKSVPQPSSGEHHSHRQRSERTVPKRPVRDRDRDPELPRPSSKRKSDYDHRDRDDHHHSRSSHHHRSESSSAARSSSAALEPPPPLPQSKSTTTDRKQKPSVFSRISFPAEEPPTTSKKRKLSSSEATAGGSASSATQHNHRSSANG